MGTLFNTLFPVFGIILLGFLACKYALMEQGDSAHLNKFVYFIAFPSLLFAVLAKAPVDQIFYWDYIGAWSSGVFITFLLTAAISHFLWQGRLSETALRSLNTTCSNTGFIGVLLVIILYGEEAAVAAIIATAFLVIVVISLTIFLIETDNDKPSQSQASGIAIVKKIIGSLFKNPLFIGATLGILAALFVDIPAPAIKMLHMLGLSAIPISLFALGLFFAGQSLAEIQQGMGRINILIILKLVIHPLITWLLIVNVFELNDQWAAMTIIMAGLPPAATCFVIAQRYHVCESETSSLTILSTLYSMVSISVILIMLGLTTL